MTEAPANWHRGRLLRGRVTEDADLGTPHRPVRVGAPAARQLSPANNELELCLGKAARGMRRLQSRHHTYLFLQNQTSNFNNLILDRKEEREKRTEKGKLAAILPPSNSHFVSMESLIPFL